jgi:hypothetical protein
MNTANFEYTGNTGILSLTTHFGKRHHIACCKDNDEMFRLGGTAVDAIYVYEAILLSVPDSLEQEGEFRAFRSKRPGDHFDGRGLVSPDAWDPSDRHGYVTEYYPLDMEGKPPGWFFSRELIDEAQCIFVNLDVLDGGGNIVKRYRVSPYTGEFTLMEFAL